MKTVKVIAYSLEKKEEIKQLCFQNNKEYEDLENNAILIKGKNLDGLLTEIKIKFLGQVSV